MVYISIYVEKIQHSAHFLNLLRRADHIYWILINLVGIQKIIYLLRQKLKYLKD